MTIFLEQNKAGSIPVTLPGGWHRAVQVRQKAVLPPPAFCPGVLTGENKMNLWEFVLYNLLKTEGRTPDLFYCQ